MTTITGAEGEDILTEMLTTIMSDHEYQELVETTAASFNLSENDFRTWVEQVAFQVKDVNIKN